ncbi:hypothetical protein QUF95_19465 [Paenibacillus silvae]|uniref:hypothetical protein n=1 Tax=Paenibacillus silvae TaxID=1325358 RepID=UPI0025A2DA89|nr:hypothetical protein [Paenibacillus silvae]MDM5279583.1 hypothetical protein [Paenibacillus silvae]
MKNSVGVPYFESEANFFDVKLSNILNRIELHGTELSQLEGCKFILEDLKKLLIESKGLNNELRITKKENRKLVLELKKKDALVSHYAELSAMPKLNTKFLPL